MASSTILSEARTIQITDSAPNSVTRPSHSEGVDQPDGKGNPKGEDWKVWLDEVLKFGNTNNLVIPVLGAAGTGKSTFINALLGTQEVKVGHTFDTGTRTLRGFRSELQHGRLVVLDTPGFDNMYISDQEIVQLISAWLAYAHTNDMKIAGIVYLYDISQPRLHPSTMRNTEIFRCLCGEDALSGVVFVTTKWDLVREQDGIAREELYRDGLWKDMILAGSAVKRFDGTQDSASEIIDRMLCKSQDAPNVSTPKVDTPGVGTPIVSTPQIQVRPTQLDDPVHHTPDISVGHDPYLKLSDFYEVQEGGSATANLSPEYKRTQNTTKKKLKGWLKTGDEIPRFGMPDDLVIPVMGATGAGKINFINALIGNQAERAGRKFNTGTRTLQQFWLSIPENFRDLQQRRLVVLDIPGFDGMYTNTSDQELLRQISAWLAYAHMRDMKIAGIIHLYDISQSQSHPAVLRNTEIFRYLCGDDALSAVVLVTTKWDLLAREEEGIIREESYRNGLWKDMISSGSTVNQFDGTQDCASKIINDILRKYQNTHLADTLKVQADLVRNITETGVDRGLRMKLPTIHDLQNKRSTITNINAEDKQTQKTTKKQLGGWLKSGDEIPRFGMPDDLVIPVMGAAGTGKSNFINTLVGKEEVRVGHNFDTGTRTLQQILLPIPQKFTELQHHRLVIVDTPGFDDLTLSDHEILRRISTWLAHAYIKDMKIAGIICLYDISQPRLHPSVFRNTEIFRCLCGDDALSTVVLVTTKWDLLVRKEDGISREESYRNGLWKDMLSAGSTVHRFDGTQDSASNLINEILRKFQNTYIVDTLQIQAEVVDLVRHIPETAAGRALQLKLSDIYQLHKKRSTATNLSEEDKKRIENLMKQVKDLNIPMSRRMSLFFGVASLGTQLSY